MEKKLWLIIVGLILLSGILAFFLGQKEYIETLKINWGISLPSPNSEVYSKNHNTALGDGEYYTILRYDNNSRTNLTDSIGWFSMKNVEFETSFQKILELLEVEENYWFNFENEYLYYFTEKEDHSKIYIIWNQKEMLVYILEYIM